jgi:hypothetical protein
MWAATEQTKSKPGERIQRSETGNQLKQANGERCHYDHQRAGVG